MKVKNPEQVLIEITAEQLLGEVMKLKRKNLRLSQLCCAYSQGNIELSYSFAEEESNAYTHLRLIVEKETEICSITELYPYAFLYENEMRELFGVNIQMIGLDYQHQLYRLQDETPFVNE